MSPVARPHISLRLGAESGAPAIGAERAPLVADGGATSRAAAASSAGNAAPIGTCTDAAAHSFLLLQGPVGPFFRELAAALRAFGPVRRVAFNSGDIGDARGDCLRFDAPLDGWPAYLVALVRAHAVTDLLLFGDCRPWHRLAVDALNAEAPSVRVHVFEEGYLRPSWITLERGGVNGFSPLLALGDDFSAAPEADLPLAPSREPGGSSLKLGLYSTRHYANVLAGRIFFGGGHTHRTRATAEAVAWVAKLARTPLRRRREAKRQTELMARRGRMFIALVQIDSDPQIRVHSGFPTMSHFIAAVIPSFARHAPDDAFLVVKNHPLDPGLHDYRRLVGEHAAAHGIAARVHFLDGGDLPGLLGRAVGVVTVNSTAGISALHRLVPVKALGSAIYDLPGLTSPQSLDDFWRAPIAPEPRAYQAFRHVIARRSQINGSFYTRAGREMLIADLTARLRVGHALSVEPVPFAGGVIGDRRRVPRPVPVPLPARELAAPGLAAAPGFAPAAPGLPSIAPGFASAAPGALAFHASGGLNAATLHASRSATAAAAFDVANSVAAMARAAAPSAAAAALQAEALAATRLALPTAPATQAATSSGGADQIDPHWLAARISRT